MHLLASIPNASWAEQRRLLDDLWVSRPTIADGFITAPETPGRGLAFKPEVMTDFSIP